MDYEAWATMDRWDEWVTDNGVEMFKELLKTARDHHRKYTKTLGPLRIENANLREELDRLQEIIQGLQG